MNTQRFHWIKIIRYSDVVQERKTILSTLICQYIRSK